MEIKPLSDYVLVTVEEETKDKDIPAGIIIPDSINREKQIMGMVVAVGPGIKNEQGEHIPVDVKEFNTVVFNRYSGTEISNGTHDYLLVREDQLLAIIKKEKHE